MIHLFNPENDLALALGCRHYTPPPNASALRSAGALLPMWWAGEGDIILAPETLAPQCRELSSRYGLHGRVATPGSPCLKGHEPSPWGWSPDAARRFERYGVDPALLPSPARLDAIRSLSHRRTTIAILKAMGTPPDRLPLEALTADEAVEMNRRYPGCYLKAPWSGSGRGVAPMAGMPDETVAAKAAGIIHRQGSVMVERGVDKLLDFAALYRSVHGRVSFEGLSLFKAENRGMYQGNVVAPQGWIESRISQLYPLRLLLEAISRQTEILTSLISDSYDGWMGVDMMLGLEPDGGVALHPCVELNLRQTMGVVALHIARRLKVKEPSLMAWHHSSTPPPGTLLLPPSDGFALMLTPMEN